MELRWRLLAVALSLATAVPASGQSQPPPSPLRFDVTSIRLARPGETSGFIKALPGGHGYTARNIPVKLMISLMYKVPMRQIQGGPEWINTEKYDVEARADGKYSLDDLHTMYQSLLADRFNLKFHKDLRPGNVFALTVDKSGSKLKRNEEEQNYDIPMNVGVGGEVIGKRVPLSYFCWWLGQQLEQDQRPVVDGTGLDGYYDFTLSFAPVLPPYADREKLPSGLVDRPPIFEALKDQLGLKLTPARASVPFYVIDQVEKPSEN